MNPAPEKNIHRDLIERSKDSLNMGFWTFVFLFLLIPMAGGFLMHLMQGKMGEALGFGVIVMIISLVGYLAMHVKSRFRKRCIHATWVYENVEPREVEAERYGYQDGDDPPAWQIVLSIEGGKHGHFEPFAASVNDMPGAHFEMQPIEKQTIRMKVYFDPANDKPLVAEDFHGRRYWLRPKRSGLPLMI